MPKLAVVQEPCHRDIFPGEMELVAEPISHPGQGVFIGLCAIQLHIQWYDHSEALPFEEWGDEGWKLHVHDSEPYSLELDWTNNDYQRIDATYIAANSAGLRAFLGELADEIEPIIQAMVNDWNEYPCMGSPRRFLRFTNMEDYNELFLAICEYIAKHTGNVFNRRAILQKILEFWEEEARTDSDNHLAMYIRNTSGENRAEEDSQELKIFRKLLATGRGATLRQLAALNFSAQN